MTFISSLLENKYDYIWKSLIRPPRDNKYTSKDLGQEKFKINSHNYCRTDFTLYNKKKQKIICSFWQPFDEERILPRLPCIIYLPGNSSSRCEATNIIQYLLPLNITVFSFDFIGSGKSDGEYISLGYYEKEDVCTVINYLRKSNKVSTIGIWGRSMGAVTALLTAEYLYNHKNNFDSDYEICAIICDSPFQSLNSLINEYVKKKIKYMLQIIINFVKKYVSDIVEKKAHFKIDKIDSMKAIKSFSHIPILFIHAMNDNFISVDNSKNLYNEYKGKKEIILFDGNHNSPRPIHIFQIASLFIYENLDIKNIKTISEKYNKKVYKTIVITNNEEDYGDDIDEKVEDDINNRCYTETKCFYVNKKYEFFETI